MAGSRKCATFSRAMRSGAIGPALSNALLRAAAAGEADDAEPRAVSALFRPFRQWNDLRGGAGLARALAQCVLQVDRDAVLLQKIGKGLVGQFLECRHPVARQLLELGGGIVVKVDQFAHGEPLS